MKTVDILDTPIEYLKGVGPKRADVLKKEINIFTFNHLLNYFPFRYVDRSKFYNVSDIDSDAAYIQIKGKIISVQKLGKPRSERLTALFQDETGTIELVWFKGVKWMVNKLIVGEEYVVFGKPAIFNRKFNIPHPEIEAVSDQKIDLGENLQPFYPSTEKLKSKGLDSKGISKITRTLMAQVKGCH